MKYVLLLILFFFLNACQQDTPGESVSVDRFVHIKDDKAQNIIKASIAHAGGLENWEAMKRLQYQKDFSLFLESGETEKTFKQVHDYHFDPLTINITSEENDQIIKTTLKDGTYSRSVNDTLKEMSQEALEKAVNTSMYVVSMPFKLIDPGAAIQYLGEEELPDGKMADVIEVKYDADKYDNHSTSDIWRYYFDQEDARILANWVQTGDHFSLIENESFDRVGGILFNKERKSFRVDSLGNKLYLRATYLYHNYQVK